MVKTLSKARARVQTKPRPSPGAAGPPAWVRVWQLGLAPQYSDVALRSLERALRTDDPRLLQGATTEPPPIAACEDWPCEGADPLAWAVWQGGDGPAGTVREVETAFAHLCHTCDKLLNEPSSIRWFVAFFWDEKPRDQARRALLAEVRRSLVLGADPTVAGR